MSRKTTEFTQPSLGPYPYFAGIENIKTEATAASPTRTAAMAYFFAYAHIQKMQLTR